MPDNSGTNNGVVEFFGAVSKNGNTIIVERSKKAVKNRITQKGLLKNNIALFKCRRNKKGGIEKTLLNRPTFKLTRSHLADFKNAVNVFLKTI